jgi:hypothetical protein
MFECYNLVNPMDWQVVSFLGWCLMEQFKDPMVTSSSIHTLISLTLSKTIEFDFKKTQGMSLVKILREIVT